MVGMHRFSNENDSRPCRRILRFVPAPHPKVKSNALYIASPGLKSNHEVNLGPRGRKASCSRWQTEGNRWARSSAVGNGAQWATSETAEAVPRKRDRKEAPMNNQGPTSLP